MNSSENPTKLNKLLEEIKGSKYEIKTLGEVVEKFIIGEEKVNKNRKNDGNFPAIVCKDIFDSDFYIDECKYFVDETTLKKLPIIERGDVMMARGGFTSQKKKGFSLFTGNYRVLAGKNVYILKHSLNSKYFRLVLDSKSVENQMEIYFKEILSSMMCIYLYDIKKIKIPLPSLELQTKIGDYLFSFAEYDKQLKREQKVRRKQFHYFKEQIFSELVERCGLRD